MYNIIQLREKELSELQEIAKELGIKKANSLEKDNLVYKILDEQAIAEAAKKSETPKKRSRVTIKQAPGKVYTASQDKATKIDEPVKMIATPTTPKEAEAPLPVEVPKAVEEAAPEAPATEAPETEAPAPKKRGRKPGSKNKPKDAVASEETPVLGEAEESNEPGKAEENTLPFAEEPEVKAQETAIVETAPRTEAATEEPAPANEEEKNEAPATKKRTSVNDDLPMPPRASFPSKTFLPKATWRYPRSFSASLNPPKWKCPQTSPSTPVNRQMTIPTTSTPRYPLPCNR